jgi:hypothetical protein
VLTYALTFEEASAAEPCLEQLCNMRRQLESKAREDRMYQMKNPNWIGALHPNRQLISLSLLTTPALARVHADWPDVQRTRVKCLEAYAALPRNTPPSQRVKFLQDVLALMFMSITPPGEVPRMPGRSSCAQAHPPTHRADRVGVIRRLRIGSTLCEDGDGYVIDLTRFRCVCSSPRDANWHAP